MVVINKADYAMQPRRGMVILTLAVAILLTIVDYPHWMQNAVPNWVLLVLFYWCIALPHRIGVGYGWMVGLILDFFHYTLLGQHALTTALIAMIAVLGHQRLRMYYLWQQCSVVLIVAALGAGVNFWIYHVSIGAQWSFAYWQTIVTTALLWPFVHAFLGFIGRRRAA